MAHFARIEAGVVREVVVIANEDAPDEATGQKFIASIGLDGEWVQTSYNATMRGKYAGIGDRWDGKDFLAPGTDLIAAAYERGKADGAAELLAAQADAEAL